MTDEALDNGCTVTKPLYGTPPSPLPPPPCPPPPFTVEALSVYGWACEKSSC